MDSYRTVSRMALFSIAAVALMGCTGVRHTLGLDKQPPDEFAVVQSPPLVMPPDFGLRPPSSPSQKPAETPVEEQARETVFRLNGNTVQAVNLSGDTAANGLTPGENAFLTAAGANSANPSIRDQLDAMAEGQSKQNRSFVDSLLFWKPAPQAPDETLDAAAEAKRLQNNEASGEAVTVGVSPMAVHRSRTLLQSIF